MNNKCQIVWNITSKCNECCKFCFRKKCKENLLKENKKIVDNLTHMNIETLSLSGGEALLYKDLFKLVKYIKIKLPNIKLILNTNGQDINEIEKIYDLIKNYNIKRWKIFKFLPVRDAQKYINDFSVSEDISRMIEDKILKMNAISKINISYNKEKKYKTKYFIYPDGTIENNKLEQIDDMIE